MGASCLCHTGELSEQLTTVTMLQHLGGARGHISNTFYASGSVIQQLLALPPPKTNCALKTCFFTSSDWFCLVHHGCTLLLSDAFSSKQNSTIVTSQNELKDSECCFSIKISTLESSAPRHDWRRRVCVTTVVLHPCTSKRLETPLMYWFWKAFIEQWKSISHLMIKKDKRRQKQAEVQNKL